MSVVKGKGEKERKTGKVFSENLNTQDLKKCRKIKLDRQISKKMRGNGAGNGGDVQLLFAEDILGDAKGPFPRHSKQYCDLYSMNQKMQDMRIQAFREFSKDVKSRKFPSEEYEVNVSDDIVFSFCEEIDKIN